MSKYSTISIDNETKKRASKMAKKDRMSISAITRILLNDYADGKITIGSQMMTANGFTLAQEAALLKEAASLRSEIINGTANSYESSEEMMEDIMNDLDV